MNAMSKRLLLKALAIAAAATMCAGSAHAAGKYVLISHAPDSDSWWNTIKNAVKQAGEDFDVTVDYRNPPSGDLADMARLVEQAAAANYDGVITSIADYNVLKGALKKVTDKKIPLITINSGTTEQSESLVQLVRELQPACIVCGRVGNQVGDYASTRDNVVPAEYSANGRYRIHVGGDDHMLRNV